MSTVLLSGGEKVMPGQIDFSKGTALGNPDDPLALHTGDGCNVSSGVQPCHAEKVSGPLSVSGKAQEKWFMPSSRLSFARTRLCGSVALPIRKLSA